MIKAMKRFFYELIANELSTITRYADSITLIEAGESQNILFEKLDCPVKTKKKIEDLSELKIGINNTDMIVLNGNFNYDLDIQKSLHNLHEKLNRQSRLLVVLYNPYWSWFFKVAGGIGIIKGGAPQTFLTKKDMHDLGRLTDFDIVRYRPVCLIPFGVLGLGKPINKILSSIPFLREISLTSIVVLRPKKPSRAEEVSLSIVIPARNEAGNIENAIIRMPKFDFKYEIIFIEGNSTDNTWDEIQRIEQKYKNTFNIKIDRQTGKGKSNAVEKGFEISSGSLLTILDADLTMPPELLPRFVEAYLSSKGDFVNGSRLLYPMEGKAMRFLNKLGNIFFANSLSFVLETRLTDSLCGTKFFTRKDYDRFLRWRQDFGKFDPFGDFDLLFPASILGLGIVNLPIRYCDRTYGETNISRFRHGFMLLKMTFVGLLKVRSRIL